MKNLDPFFGDVFRLEDLSLPRPADGYAVQRLGHDEILDRATGVFLPVRHPRLEGLFACFARARAAAEAWQARQEPTVRDALAIVPAAFDPVFMRHVLIHGVLMPRLTVDEEAVYIMPRKR
ncbi:MAG: hypothetical protein LBO79_02050 [Zoogloeaceae bacterium]|nr:hypothetical protein [Zoogloeaceae bacterium]